MSHCKALPPLDPHIVEAASQIFKALSDPTRLKILHLLSVEECSVSRIAEQLGLTPSAISHQLAYLRTLRLVRHRREGHTVYYSCDDDHVLALLRQTIEHVTHTSN
ncbi:ArsR/SmtB family transcription factor [Polycladomyces subterraneus]|uniref:Metalloregulator ArsR/SmtB family transcription factor n=1 Tax=Polycladomyces subterraneus TaxID=1016997 RepID=A0ABT8IND4_9BACL|nr:metalloregulator ArsR/SmtB family transcription factor [Polycladomyces subterraneus]MDN4594252.1 metalloregulator ArsR/SmtB family transcription factor [Polycladomyces subterraneus]